MLKCENDRAAWKNFLIYEGKLFKQTVAAHYGRQSPEARRYTPKGVSLESSEGWIMKNRR
ncbi:MAG: hypothetical protein EBT19_04680 [Methylocystaceae bacterium]|nr:hypothetical protein [Methylocystaceae bacterium]NBV94689.1 hypothetical protein [Methylocystaceae bacterium]